MDSDHHQRADGHVVAVGSTAATQASQGTVAAVVTTAIMVWSLVLVVLEARANRRGGAVLRPRTALHADASRSRTQAVKPPPTGPQDQGRTEEAGGKSGLIEFGTLGPHRVGLPALRFGRDGVRLKAASGAARPLPERKVPEGRCGGSLIGGRQRCRRSAAAEFLANQRIAVTGVSRNPQGHASNLVYQRLRERGYQVVAVNPNASNSKATGAIRICGRSPVAWRRW